jgi:hypothetical protein
LNTPKLLRLAEVLSHVAAARRVLVRNRVKDVFVRLDEPQDLSLRSPTLQALGMKVPADLYARSPRVSGPRGTHLSLPRSDHHADGVRSDLLPRPQGEPQSCLRWPERCVTQVGERIWLVTFMHYDFGVFR